MSEGPTFADLGVSNTDGLASLRALMGPPPLDVGQRVLAIGNPDDPEIDYYTMASRDPLAQSLRVIGTAMHDAKGGEWPDVKVDGSLLDDFIHLGEQHGSFNSAVGGINALMKEREPILGGIVFYDVEPSPVYKPNAVYCSRGKWFGPPHEGQCNGEPTRSCDAWTGPR